MSILASFQNKERALTIDLLSKMTNQTSLRPNATLRGGTYRIDRVLGQGGFGITYLATDLSLDKPVAIKEFFPKDYCDRDATTSHVTLGTQTTTEFVKRLKAKFLKEAKNIARFDHPNIIKIHAAFEENNTAYYVMDFIKGESLSERVKHQGVLPRTMALDLVTKIGTALDYIHSFSMNHLDVKPANIMVRESDNRPILIDFGLSKQYDSSGHQTSTTPVGISHGYAPMEQYNDGGVNEFSPTTDEYSLAATLYYLLSGITPPQATKLVEDDLIFPDSIPTDLITPISKAMSSARKDRYPTVNQFIAALNPKSEETSIPAPKPEPKPQPKPTPTPEPESEPESSSRKWWIVGGAVALLAIVLMVWQPWQPEQKPAGAIPENTTKTETKAKSVTSMFYHSANGDCSYTGEVDDKNLPNGKGVAMWNTGSGLKYDGEWVHGVMEGEAKYYLRNGDTFAGTYKGNEFHEGVYTLKSTGEYFKGTYKESKPAKGAWYDKAGTLIETL